MTTTVVNKKTGAPYDVYIGRGSDWGNPFRIGPDHDRDAVVALYEEYITGRPDLLARLDELRGKRIACFCAPLACHGDVLARLADTGATASGRTDPEPPASFHVSLTGHRPAKLDGYDLSTPFYAELRLWLEQIIAQGLDKHEHLTLHSGMALGADTVWAQAIVAMRAQYPGRIAFVAEVPVMTQPDRWISTTDKNRWRKLVDGADQVNVYAQRYHVSCLHQRNHGMIDAADLLLAVWDGSATGGTAEAVRYAEKTGTRTYRMTPARVRERAGLR